MRLFSRFFCRPRPLLSADDAHNGLTAIIYIHMLDDNTLFTSAPKPSKGLHLQGVRPKQLYRQRPTLLHQGDRCCLPEIASASEAQDAQVIEFVVIDLVDGQWAETGEIVRWEVEPYSPVAPGDFDDE